MKNTPKHKGRVLCLTSSFPSSANDSAGIFVYNLAKDLSELGWFVDILAPHAPGLSEHERIDNVEVFRFRYFWPESSETIFQSGSAAVNLRKRPWNYFKVPPFLVFQSLKILQKLKERKYDLIHSHWVVPQGLSGMIGSLTKGIPHIVTIHGGDIYSFNYLFLKYIKSFILHRAHAVTVNSSATFKRLLSLVKHLSRVENIPMGISFYQPEETEVAKIRQKYRRGTGPLLLFVGRIVEEKGVGDFIEAIQQIQRAFPDTRGIIVGDGQEKDKYIRIVNELRMTDTVFFIGQIPPSRICNYYAAADIFIGPSKKAKDGWMEGMGLTFIEAMYAKLPVIAARSGGIVDSVQHEKTGQLVDENAPEQIAQAIERLIREPELKDNNVRNGYTLASKHFSRKASAQKFSTLYQKVLQSNESD